MSDYLGVKFMIEDKYVLLSKAVMEVLSNHSEYFKDHVQYKLYEGKYENGLIIMQFTEEFMTFQMLDLCIGVKMHNIWNIDLVKLLYLANGIMVNPKYVDFLVKYGVEYYGPPTMKQARKAIYFCWYNATQYIGIGEYLLELLGKDYFPDSLTKCKSYREFKKRFRDMFRHDIRLDWLQVQRPFHYEQRMRQSKIVHTRYNVGKAFEDRRCCSMPPRSETRKLSHRQDFHQFCPVCKNL